MNVDKSTGNLLNDVMARVSGLVRGEVDMARAEINENLSKAATAVGMIVGAVVIALTALNVLSAALVAALTEAGIPGGWSALIVGVDLRHHRLCHAAEGQVRSQAELARPHPYNHQRETRRRGRKGSPS